MSWEVEWWWIAVVDEGQEQLVDHLNLQVVVEEQKVAPPFWQAWKL